MQRRKDSKGRVLKDGEQERKQGNYMYRWTDAFGVRQCIYAKTLEELREKERSPRCIFMSADMTVDELFTLWFESKYSLKPATKYNYKRLYNLYIKNELGALKISKIDRKIMYEFRMKCLREKSQKKRYNMKFTVVLNHIFEYAVQNELLYKNPILGLFDEDVHYKNNRRVGLTESEEQALLSALEGDPYKFVIEFLLLTGLRVNEAMALTWKDLDFENSLIYISKSLGYYGGSTDYKRYITTPKTDNSVRSVYMPVYLRDTLLSMPRNDSVSIDDFSGFIFVSKSGRPYLANAINKSLKNAANKAGITKSVTCHVLRHTYTTRLIERGTNIRAVQAQLGHKSSKTTLDSYTDFSPAMQKDIARAIEHIADQVIQNR